MVIRVEIERSQNSTDFNETDSFFKNELDQTKRMINRIIKNKPKIESNQTNEENHFYRRNTIAILGPRGAGKTSFLLSLKNSLKEDKGFREKIIWLPSIDPTRVEKNETFLVIVVANALKKIQQINKEIGQKIRDKLDVLSRDFVVLAPSQVHEDQWKDLLGDPNSFAYELLSHAHSGLSLAKSFNNFLSVCLEEMRGAIFIQPIDDVDSGIDQGWPILETLRRYMASPYLITILSGDIRLYQSLVRKQHVDQFRSLIDVRHDITQEEPKFLLQTAELVNQIFQITDQYLAKVIPSHLRINLTPLSKKIINSAEQGEEFISIKYDISENFQKEENPENLEKIFPAKAFSEIYAKLSQDLFNIPIPSSHNQRDLDLLKKTSWLPLPLLPLTTRNMLRFLKVIQPWAMDDSNEPIRIKIDKENAIEALAHVFNSSLYNGGIQTEDLLSIKREKNIEWFAEYCLNIEQKFPGFWTLESRYGDEEMNHRTLLLQAFLLQAWKARKNGLLTYSDGPLSYVIKVCFPCWIVDNFNLNVNDFQSFKGSLNVGYTKRHTYLAGEGLSYVFKLTIKREKEKEDRKKKDKDNENEKDKENAEEEKKTSIPNSGISTSLEDDDKKKESTTNHYIGITTTSPKIYSSKKIRGQYANEAHFILRWFTFRTESHLLISILMGLARLTDVLREGPEDSEKLKNFLYFLIEHGMLELRHDNEPDATFVGNSFDAEPSEKKLKEFETLEFLEYLRTWTGLIKQEKVLSNGNLVSPLVISRTFVRFSRNLDSIRQVANKNTTKKNIFNHLHFGEMLEIWIAALLNSLLIEEVIFKRGISDANLRLDHLIDNKSPFIHNLDDLINSINSDATKNINYTLIMLCCPFFLIFLRKNFENYKSSLFTNIIDIIEKKTENNFLTKHMNFIDKVSNQLYKIPIRAEIDPKTQQIK